MNKRKLISTLLCSSMVLACVQGVVFADEEMIPEETDVITEESISTGESESDVIESEETTVVSESVIEETEAVTDESELIEVVEETVPSDITLEDSDTDEVTETEESYSIDETEIAETVVVSDETDPSDIIDEEVSDVEAAGVALNSTNFPDYYFRKYLSDNYDYDDSGYLSSSEISDVTSISCDDEGINDLTGIKVFTSLRELDCRENNLRSLDLSNMTSLEAVWCEDNLISSLNLSGTSNLKILECYRNRLASINISSCTSLKGVYEREEPYCMGSITDGGYIEFGGLDCYLDIDPTTVIKGGFGSPTNISLYSDTPSSIKISWGAIDGAIGYEVWRYPHFSYEGSKTRIYDGSKTSITISSLKSATDYTYAVRAYKKTSSGQKIYSQYSLEYSCRTLPAAPSITAVTRKGSTGAEFNITWNRVNGAEGYQVVRSTSPNGTYNAFITTTKLTATDYNRTVGTMYYYKVRAYYKLDGVTYYGPYSSAKMIKVPTVPTGLKITSTARNSITLTWNKVAGANVNYEIWRSRSRNSGFVCIGRFDQNSKVSTKLTSGTTYYYKVRAYYYCYDSQGRVHRIYGQYTSVVSGTTKR